MPFKIREVLYLNKDSNFDWKVIFGSMGAFISYTVGAGFASGNEVMQFIGSWGVKGAIIASLAGFIVAAIYTVCLYKVGQKIQFEKTSDIYEFFGGKVLGNFYKIFVFLFILSSYMLLFSGAGSLLNQQLGWPQWVGSVIMSVISGVVVLGGLKRVEVVLGSARVVILGYVFIFTIISSISPESSLDSAIGLEEQVKNGVIYRANLFEMFPLSVLGITYNYAWFTGMLYTALCVVSGFPFYLILGRRAKSQKEATVSGIVTTGGFILCVLSVAFLMILNFDALVNPSTGEMYPFPAMAAVDKLWPSGSWTYTLVISKGLFTSLTGYTYILKDWFLPGEEKTRRSNIFIIVLLTVGLALGGIIPFSKLINILFPFTGVVGLIMTVSFAVKVKKIESDLEISSHEKIKEVIE